MNYERMAKLHDYVYSTPSNSPEREQRIAELSEVDQEALYDYKIGLLSGRIKKSDYKQEADNMLTFQEWKKIQRGSSLKEMSVAVDFKKQYPLIDKEYQQRKETEEKKRREIMAIKDGRERQEAIARNLELF